MEAMKTVQIQFSDEPYAKCIQSLKDTYPDSFVFLTSFMLIPKSEFAQSLFKQALKLSKKLGYK